MSRYLYMAPDFVSMEEAKVSVETFSFIHGMNVFEGIRGYWNGTVSELYIFRLSDHLERLRRSGRIMRIELPADTATLIEVFRGLVKRNEYREDIYFRPIAYKGVPRQLGVTLTDAPDHFLILSFPLGKYLATQRPLRVCVSSWQRIPDNAAPARGKIGGAYINSALAKTDAVEQGFDECIMLTGQGTVAEGSTENLFLVYGGDLITPPVTEDILVGITRTTVMELARRELGLKVVERIVDRSELYIADECFFCGTGAEIAGIGEIDGRPIGDGEMGPITGQLQKLYLGAVRGEIERYLHWCTPVYKSS